MRRLQILFAAFVAATAIGAASAAPVPAAHTPAAVVKTCSSGYKHAVIGGAQKCLRAGEFCTHSLDRQYRHYGYRCIKYYANVQRYRLTHG
jgi:hypothetical protein